MYYVLIVDDDPKDLALLTDTLSFDADIEAGQARSGQEALTRLQDARQHRVDLVILDIMMPGMSGLELCQQLRRDPRFMTLPVLFLTARGQVEDIVQGLDAGGDDYVVKPFLPAELIARVRALLRRTHLEAAPGDIIEVGGLKLDSNTCQAHFQGKTVQLTATEHRLLRYMMEHANQPLSPQHLLEAVWEYPTDTGDSDLVRVHVRNLRAKIEPDSRAPRFIHTVHSIGYVVRNPPNS